MWIYSVVRQTISGAPVIVLRQGGWTAESAIHWARVTAPREEPEGTTIGVYRSRGSTGKARVLPYRAYVIEDGSTRRTDRSPS